MKSRIVSVAAVMAVCLSASSEMKALSSGTGLEASVAVDSVGQFDVSKDGKSSDAINVREAELTFFAPVDHQFDAVLSLAAHREHGVSVFELHEATIGSSKLLPGLSFRVGQFFLGLGRLNRVHRHDWPFISAPKVFRKFFDSEGVIDAGAEASYLLPLPFYLEVIAGVTNGWTYGHAHDEGKKPVVPTHYARIGGFIDGGEAFGLALGLNYLGRKSATREQMQLVGLDGVAKGDIGGIGYLLQSEAWLRTLKPDSGDEDKSAGAYVFPQVQFSKSLLAGVRLDYFTVLSLEDASGEKLKNSEQAIVPTITYKSSEFATFKLAYHHAVSSQEGQDDQTDRSVELQATFILGAHPAHDF